MEYFEQKIEEQEDQYPDWVSPSNASIKAYLATLAAREEKLAYIHKSNRKSHFKVKNNYQIVGSEIARRIEIAKATLLTSSSYSHDYSDFLKTVNKELLEAASLKIEQATKNKSRGAISKTKSELVKKAKTDKQRIADLEKANAQEQVKIAFSRLSPAVRKLLYLPETKPKGNVIEL